MVWFSPRPTQDENTFPQPPCENLLARPCNPPLCCKRPPRTPTSAFEPPESVFPLTAPSIESRNPIILLSSWLLNFLYFRNPIRGTGTVEVIFFLARQTNVDPCYVFVNR